MVELFTDENLKKQLESLGLDPTNPTFLENPLYKKIKNKKIITNDFGAVTYDYYIRKNWFEDIGINMKKGRFDIGAPHTSESVNLAMLIDEICQEAMDRNEADEALYDPDNVKRKLIGNSSGIRTKLKTKINFDFNNYNGQELEKLKILKLLYLLEKDPENKINITSLLSYLSLENVEKEFIGDKSVHGEIITGLLSEVRIELDSNFHKKASDVILSIVNQWNAKLLQISQITRMPHDKSVQIHELNRIKSYLINLKKRLSTPKMDTQSNILEAFYLRILQLQLLCRTEDINRITKFISESSHTKKLLNIQSNYYYNNSLPIVIEDLNSFIDHYKDKLAVIVYQKNTVTPSEITTIIKWSEHIPTLLAIYQKQMHLSHEQPLTSIFVASCLQEILLSKTLKKGDDEHEFKNDYYRSDRKARTVYPTLEKMTKNISIEEALELIWVQKIYRRINANLGLLEEELLINEIGTLVNEFIAIIVQLPDLEAMQCWNDFLLSQVIVAKNAPIVNYAGIFDNIIREKTGYSCKLHTIGIFQYFDNTEAANTITDIFVNIVKKHIQLNHIQNELKKQYLQIQIDEQRFIVVFALEASLQHLIIYNFLPIKTDKELDLMRKVGLEKFVDNI